MNHNQSSKPSVKALKVLKLLNDLVFTPFLILLVKLVATSLIVAHY